MAFCSGCGVRIVDEAKFCHVCGTPAGTASAGSIQRQQAYSGKISKCPHCGETLKSFEAICPSCMHEINAVKLTSAFQAFVNEVKECDRLIAEHPAAKNGGWSAWSDAKKGVWVVLNVTLLCVPLALYLALPLLGFRTTSAFSPEEKRKVALIKNYVYPNERESILELLFFIKAQMRFLVSMRASRISVRWADIWQNKAELIYHKVEMMLKGDEMANAAYHDIVLNRKRVRQSLAVRAIMVSSLTCALLVFIISGGLSNLGRIIGERLDIRPVITNGAVYEWPAAELGGMLPVIEAGSGKMIRSNDDQLSFELNGISSNRFEEYVIACKEKGFTLESKKADTAYEAYNGSGYALELRLNTAGRKMTITLNAPMAMTDIQWPGSHVAQSLPLPSSGVGQIQWDRSNSFRVYMGGTDADAYRQYIDDCMSRGFNIDYKRNEKTFSAQNEQGYKLSVSYEGFYTMLIRIDGSDKADDTTLTKATPEPQPTDTQTPQPTPADTQTPKPTPIITQTPEPQPPEESASLPGDALVDLRDSIEAFMEIINSIGGD